MTKHFVWVHWLCNFFNDLVLFTFSPLIFNNDSKTEKLKTIILFTTMAANMPTSHLIVSGTSKNKAPALPTSSLALSRNSDYEYLTHLSSAALLECNIIWVTSPDRLVQDIFCCAPSWWNHNCNNIHYTRYSVEYY